MFKKNIETTSLTNSLGHFIIKCALDPNFSPESQEIYPTTLPKQPFFHLPRRKRKEKLPTTEEVAVKSFKDSVQDSARKLYYKLPTAIVQPRRYMYNVIGSGIKSVEDTVEGVATTPHRQ